MESQNVFLYAIQNDWAVLIPIFICSILLVAAAVDRIIFYNRNKRDVVQFIHRLQREMNRGSLDNAQVISSQLGGVVGEVAEEGIRILSEQKESFDRAFDITASLARRKLESRLSIIGTIATVSPYLGLFATVVRILLTFGELAQSQSANAAPQVMFGIGSALIATALGLFVAISAVALNNWFQSTVNRYEDDFQLLKLLFLSFMDAQQGDVRASAGAGGGGYRTV
ncbi:MAG: MotA/TolQ/ExbB proton channel family protein [Vampirovibrionales bacterium]|nr:MotA/TolQ/ExbB proton channel family protein [Vampirovibrionales bacterium]